LDRGGMMNPEELDIQQDEINLLEKQLIQLRDYKKEIEDNPVSFVQTKLSYLAESIIKKADRKSEDGNVTMKEHLINLKETIENDKDAFVEKTIKDLNDNMTRISQEIDNKKAEEEL
jgi:DNA polymerase II small subunit/DNA polymerase delta subunit B